MLKVWFTHSGGEKASVRLGKGFERIWKNRHWKEEKEVWRKKVRLSSPLTA